MTADNLSIGPRLDWINHFINLQNYVDKNTKELCGLNITQSRILFYIATHEPRPIGSVGTSLFLKPSTITAATNHLVDDGYISRAFGVLDRRTVDLDITDKGIETTSNYIPAVRKAFEQDCSPVFPEKRDELRKLLLPASSHVFFGTNSKEITAIATRIASDLHLNLGQDEIVEHITRVLVIESISYFLSKTAEINSGLDLSPNEARILQVLSNDNSGMRLKELSAAINIRPNVASLSIRTLSDRDLIERAVDRKDRRAASVKLSRKGARLAGRANEMLRETFDACYPGLAERELSEFFEQ